MKLIGFQRGPSSWTLAVRECLDENSVLIDYQPTSVYGGNISGEMWSTSYTVYSPWIELIGNIYQMN